MVGAVCLAARAAGRAGAGLVKVAVPESVWDVVAGKLDEPLTAGWPATRGGAFSEKALAPLLEAADWADVVVLGPGLGADPQSVAVVRAAVRQIAKPLVLDADGLNALAGRTGALKQAQEAQRDRPLILTPHPGEMARLMRTTVKAVQADREAVARRCAGQTGTVVLLKGAGTIVTDGRRRYLNTTGNPGMATGGSGDVLAGLIGALVGQGLAAYEATCLAAHLHGLAGDLAAQRLTQWSLVAGDLIDELPNAFHAYQQAGAS